MVSKNANSFSNLAMEKRLLTHLTDGASVAYFSTPANAKHYGVHLLMLGHSQALKVNIIKCRLKLLCP